MESNDCGQITNKKIDLEGVGEQFCKINLHGPKKYSKPLELDLGGSRDLSHKDVARLLLKT